MAQRATHPGSAPSGFHPKYLWQNRRGRRGDYAKPSEAWLLFCVDLRTNRVAGRGGPNGRRRSQKNLGLLHERDNNRGRCRCGLRSGLYSDLRDERRRRRVENVILNLFG